MKLFKRNKMKSVHYANVAQDKIAKGIAGFLLNIQIRSSTFMNTWMNQLGSNAKRIWLLIFCIVFGALSIYSFVGAFKSDKISHNKIKPAQLSVPKYYDQNEVQNLPTVSKNDMQRIEKFKKYMDSLKGSVRGKPVYDSILTARPGLMDSVQTIEQLYYSQSK